MDVPAGWYPDPASPASARWWDGTGWTEHTTPLQPQPPAPQASYAAPDPAPPADARTPADWAGAPTVVVAVPSPDDGFVPPLVPVPAPPAGYADTAAYPSSYDTTAYDPAAYDASAYATSALPAAPAQRSGVSWGVVALIAALVLVLVAAAALVVRSITSGSGGSTAASSGPTSAPGTSSTAPTTPTPSATTPTPTGGTAPATAAEASVVLETFKPTTADLPSGVDTTLIPQGAVVKGQKTLDGWCSTSYASEKFRIARRQWALTENGQSIGLSIESVAYGTPAQAAAALAEFTARTKACADVTIVDSGTTLVQRLVSSGPLTGLPQGISGYRGVATFTGKSTTGTSVTVNSTSSVQQKGQYLTIVWTNQSTPITAADQQVIDRFVAQQSGALAATTS